MPKRKGVTLSAPYKRSPEEMQRVHGRDPDYPAHFVWAVKDSMGTVFADESAEGALALAKQYHRMK